MSLGGLYRGGWGETFAERRLVSQPSPESTKSSQPIFVDYPSAQTQFSLKHYIEKNATPFGGYAPKFEGDIKRGPVFDVCHQIKPTYSVDGGVPRDSFDQSYLKNKQYGYQDRTWENTNLKGNFNFCGSIGGGSCGGPYKVSDPRHEMTVGGGGMALDPTEVNKQSMSYGYGLRGVAPNGGKDLPGVLRTNLLRGKGRGTIVETWKRNGYTDGWGVASGYMTAQSNANGLEDLPVAS